MNMTFNNFGFTFATLFEILLLAVGRHLSTQLTAL